jgi:hypothetical protein
MKYTNTNVSAPQDSAHKEYENISLGNQFLVFQSHSVPLKCQKPITHTREEQNPQPHHHGHLRTDTPLNLQHQHSFHITVSMSYSMCPLGLVAQNLTSVIANHHINILLKSNMPHDTFSDVCLCIQIMQQPSHHRIMQII